VRDFNAAIGYLVRVSNNLKQHHNDNKKLHFARNRVGYYNEITKKIIGEKQDYGVDGDFNKKKV